MSTSSENKLIKKKENNYWKQRMHTGMFRNNLFIKLIRIKKKIQSNLKQQKG